MTMDLHAIAKDASERVHKNGGCVPQLAFAPILWALQDALTPNAGVDPTSHVWDHAVRYQGERDWRLASTLPPDLAKAVLSGEMKGWETKALAALKAEGAGK